MIAEEIGRATRPAWRAPTSTASCLACACSDRPQRRSRCDCVVVHQRAPSESDALAELNQCFESSSHVVEVSVARWLPLGEYSTYPFPNHIRVQVPQVVVAG